MEQRAQAEYKAALAAEKEQEEQAAVSRCFLMYLIDFCVTL